MGGVDRNDGQLQSYKLAREHLMKYYQKMFRYLLDVVCQNAFIIYKKKGGSISRLDFLLTLAESSSSMGGVVEPATRVAHQNHQNPLDSLDAAAQTWCQGHQRSSLPGDV